MVAVVTPAGAPKKRKNNRPVAFGAMLLGTRESSANAPENCGVGKLYGTEPVFRSVIEVVVDVLAGTLFNTIFVVETVKPAESRCEVMGIALMPPVALSALEASTSAAFCAPIRCGLYAITIACVMLGLMNNGVLLEMFAGETIEKSVLGGLIAAPESTSVVAPVF